MHEEEVRIGRLFFDVLSADAVRRRSVVEVTESQNNDKNIPKAGGVNDHRMGTLDRRYPCGTCGMDMSKCIGHTGHIELAVPVYNHAYLDMVLDILRLVCFWCSGPLKEDVMECKTTTKREVRYVIKPCEPVAKILCTKKGRKRLVALRKASRPVTRRCRHCFNFSPTYKKKGYRIVSNWSKVRHLLSPEDMGVADRSFTSLDAQAILSNISETTTNLLMGPSTSFMHPADLLITAMLVPPPCLRPVVMQSDMSRAKGQDDLTIILCKIVKKSNTMKAFIEAMGPMERLDLPSILSDVSSPIGRTYEELQFFVAQYMDSNISSKADLPGGKGAVRVKETKSLVQRLKSKEGVIRGIVMGKRVEQAARTVITGNPDIRIDEVGVPEWICLKLTVPIRVNARNRKNAMRRIIKGPGSIEGANGMTLHDGNSIDFRHLDARVRQSMYLADGVIVHRPLNDGDDVIMNRQPTLHPQSIMAHKVRVVKDKSFQINPAITTPYNADFDGDEMNMHVPQSIKARADARFVMAVSENALDASSNRASYGLIQDVIVGAFLMTSPDYNVIFDRAQATRLLCAVPRLFDEAWGLPPTDRPNGWSGQAMLSMLLPPGFCFRKGTVVVENGHIVRGTFDKSILGTSGGGMIHCLAKDYTGAMACRFVYEIQLMVVEYLRFRGFSVGLRDCITDPHTQAMVENVITHHLRGVDYFESLVSEGKIHADPQRTEGHVCRLLAQIIDHAGRIVMSRSDIIHNRFNQMVKSGSKGSVINLCQSMATVGQQTINGRRPDAPPGCNNAPRRRGFVQQSYTHGLNPNEFFTHAKAGREGLVDTAVKTADTGYIQRRLMKALESLLSSIDGTVRNPEGFLIQWLYGGDGMNAKCLEKVTLRTVAMSRFSLQEWLGLGAPEIFVVYMWNMIDDARRDMLSLMTPELTSVVYVPVNMSRVVARYTGAAEEVDSHVYDEILRACRILEGRFSGNLAATRYLRLHICEVMATTPMSLTDTREVLSHVVDLHEQATCEYGHAVGPLAAASIGEPTTQLTLNTFHYAGVGSKNVTMGVPRLKEVIDYSGNMRTPSITVYMMPDVESDPARIRALSKSLVHLVLMDVAQDYRIIDEPDPTKTPVEEDQPIVDMALAAGVIDHDRQDDWSRFVVRFVLDKVRMVRRGLQPDDVAHCIEDSTGSNVQVCASRYSMKEWVLRVRFVGLEPKDMADPTHEYDRVFSILTNLRESVKLAGIPGISMATQRIVKSSYVAEDGSVQTRTRTAIDTQGTALQEVWAVPGVDWTHTISNNIREVHSVLGLYAAMAMLFHEVKNVLSFDGGYVDPRHLALLASLMTQSGSIMPMTRYGINKASQNSVTTRASFEESWKVLTSAAFNASVDHMRGVTANIMVGQTVPVGSGAVRLAPTGCTIGIAGHNIPTQESTTSDVVYRSVITSWADDIDGNSRHMASLPPAPAVKPTAKTLDSMLGLSDVVVELPGEMPEPPTSLSMAPFRPLSPTEDVMDNIYGEHSNTFRPETPTDMDLREMFADVDMASAFPSEPPPTYKPQAHTYEQDGLEALMNSLQPRYEASSVPQRVIDPKPLNQTDIAELTSSLDVLLGTLTPSSVLPSAMDESD